MEEKLCKCGQPAIYGRDCWKSHEEFEEHKERMLNMPFPEGTICECGLPALHRSGNFYTPTCYADGDEEGEKKHEAHRNNVQLPVGALCSCGLPATHRIYGQPSCYAKGDQEKYSIHVDRIQNKNSDRMNEIWAKSCPPAPRPHCRECGGQLDSDGSCPDCEDRY